MFGLVREKRLKELQIKYDVLQNRIDECEKIQTRNKELETELYSLRTELTTIKAQIREQTEGDLFFISAKIQKELLDGKTKKDIEPLYSQQIAYQNLLAQQQSNMYSHYPQNSLLSQLGFGGLFGGRY